MSYAQKQESIKINYNIVFKDVDYGSKKMPASIKGFFYESLEKKKELIESIDFILISNKVNYTFYYKKPMLSDNNNYLSITGTVSRAIDGDMIFGNIKDRIAILGGFDVGVKIDRKINMNNINWELIKETKIIMGKTCYKAKGELKNLGAANKNDYPVIAWYCPEINYQCGPTPFAILPGAILELENKKTLITANKISFGKFKTPTFKSKKRILPYPEYIKYMTKWSEENVGKRKND